MILYYLLIISMPYVDHWIWDANIGGGITVTKLLGALCLLYAIIYLTRRHGTVNFFRAPQAKWMMLFFGIATYSFFTGSHEVFNFGHAYFTYFSAFFFFFITLIVIDSISRLYWSLMVAVGSMGFASLYMIREWQKGFGGGNFRPGWIFGDANYFTVAALAVLPLGFQLMLVSSKKWLKLFCLCCLLLMFAAITLGASRGGFLGVCAVTLYLVLNSRNPLKSVARLAVMIIPFLVLAPSSPLHRLLSPATGDTESVETHLAGWQAGLTMIKQNPLTGVGIGNYKPTVIRYDIMGLANADPHVAHNGFLEVAAEMGLPAFVVYLIFFGTTFSSLGRTKKRALARGSNMLAAIALGMQASLLGVWVAIFFVSGQYTKFFWLILCMTMALPQLPPPRPATRKEAPPEQPQEEPAFQVGEALAELR